MIGMLTGTVTGPEPGLLLVSTGGVGYEVTCAPATWAQAQGGTDKKSVSIGQERTLFIHTAVSDDGIRLYGFGSRDELRLFRLLITVDRVGPRAALALAGSMPFSDLIAAIRLGNVDALARAPGIGKKTAQRIILELREKSNDLLDAGTALGPPSDLRLTALTTLTAMGFPDADAREALDATSGGEDSASRKLEEIVRLALRYLDRPTGHRESIGALGTKTAGTRSHE